MAFTITEGKDIILKISRVSMVHKITFVEKTINRDFSDYLVSCFSALKNSFTLGEMF